MIIIGVLKIEMLDTSSTQFDSFLFWRQPIPSLDLSELEDLGISTPKSKQAKSTKSSQKPLGQEEEDDLELLKYSAFNYWKEPVASIDTLDFSLLL
ncbi:protein AF1q isoform X1 [Sinocyclocheilus grahami]|nr:PREDICTED: protein AF1q isoform X1 [Sinocyclocheilus grahami]